MRCSGYFQLPSTSVPYKDISQVLSINLLGICSYCIFLHVYGYCGVTQRVNLHFLFPCDIGRSLPLRLANPLYKLGFCQISGCELSLYQIRVSPMRRTTGLGPFGVTGNAATALPSRRRAIFTEPFSLYAISTSVTASSS